MPNPYLQGNFAPVLEERTDDHELPVDGVLPPDLEGQLLRNGPNPAADAAPGALDKATARDYEFGNVNPSDPASDIYDHTARNQANAKIKDRGFAD